MSTKPPSVVSSEIKSLKKKLAGSYQAVLAAMEESGVDDPQKTIARDMELIGKCSKDYIKRQVALGARTVFDTRPGGKELLEIHAFFQSASSELSRIAQGKVDIDDFAVSKPLTNQWQDMMGGVLDSQPLYIFTEKSNLKESTYSDYVGTFIIRCMLTKAIAKKSPMLAQMLSNNEKTLDAVSENDMQNMGLSKVVATTKLFWEDWKALQNTIRAEAKHKSGNSRRIFKVTQTGAAPIKKNGHHISNNELQIRLEGAWKSALDEFRKEYQKDTKKVLSPDTAITCGLLVQDFPAGTERSHQLLQRGLLAVCAYEAMHHNWINEAQKKVIENSNSVSRLREVLKDKTTNELFGILHSLHQMQAEHEFLVCAALFTKEDITELTKVLADYALSSSTLSEHHNERKPLRGIISDFFEAAQTRLYAKAPYVYEPPSLQR